MKARGTRSLLRWEVLVEKVGFKPVMNSHSIRSQPSMNAVVSVSVNGKQCIKCSCQYVIFDQERRPEREYLDRGLKWIVPSV